ncbi:methylated-DNA--[protein]-cysteine S-methyltransferase [Actinokineospora auranticolor]|uniref:methylated-DNA--[protein]-cysteine S-methyltransferase n=1 Tax=Actinokineospora auranticolor TaxID=155976 RepID=A0A2S6GUJ8_9PSEU|nr:methylated-DNA--[protein]-cysteine S-methyltransferase [Actinokineospora auranticolor]PPK68867.1 methylated-DNA-[protein]-cysteine S-methyltransferase [Actinokineospora auranticolor]
MWESGYALFDTAIGRCGVAWGPRGIVAVQLPERNPAATVARLRRFGEEAEPPEEVRSAITRMVAHLGGAVDDLVDIAVDPSEVPEFDRRVHEVARAIPPGETLTYGEVANRLGLPGSAQAVGQALGRNPYPIIIPCHRILGANGKVGGFSAGEGAVTKLRILGIEGAAPNGQPSLFD